jgi:CRP-like cAMP-binding protein
MEPDKSPLLKLIDKVSFFNDFLESEKCELIDKKLLVKKYEKEGSTIFREGDKGGSVVVVLSGEVSVIKSTVPATDKGKISLVSPKDITIAKLGAGSVIGEVSLLSNTSRTTGVVTSTPLVIALEINKWHLQSFNSTIQSKFHEQFISILIKRLEDMNKKFGRTKIQPPSDKI